MEMGRFEMCHCATAKVIIVSPHLDDEVLGCASFIDKEVLVVYATQYHPIFPDKKNIEENKELVETIGFEAVYMGTAHKTNNLDTIGQAVMIDKFEKIFNKYQPETVILPCPSYNQDHRVIYDATLTALRPHDKNHFVKRVLLYEQPETFGTLRKPDPFHPTYFRHLDIEFKLYLMTYYGTQMRGHRTFDHISAIAKVRGMQANMDYAEAFEVVRWIE